MISDLHFLQVKNIPGCYIYFEGTILLFLDIINCDVDDGCHENATCTDANGNYTCVCKNGFTGDGFNCTGNNFTIPPI